MVCIIRRLELFWSTNCVIGHSEDFLRIGRTRRKNWNSRMLPCASGNLHYQQKQQLRDQSSWRRLVDLPQDPLMNCSGRIFLIWCQFQWGGDGFSLIPLPLIFFSISVLLWLLILGIFIYHPGSSRVMASSSPCLWWLAA